MEAEIDEEGPVSGAEESSDEEEDKEGDVRM